MPIIPNKPDKPDRWEIAELLAAVDRMPRVELYDWIARAALLEAIRAGEVIGIYKPFGSILHNIELRHDLIAGDPRLSAEEWEARCHVNQTSTEAQGGQAK